MYDENHVTIVPKSGNYIKSDRYKLWDCFLCGELVGGIQFITDGGYKSTTNRRYWIRMEEGQ